LRRRPCGRFSAPKFTAPKFNAPNAVAPGLIQALRQRPSRRPKSLPCKRHETSAMHAPSRGFTRGVTNFSSRASPLADTARRTDESSRSDLAIPYAVQSGFRYPAFALIQLSLFLRSPRCLPLGANPLRPTFRNGLPNLYSGRSGQCGTLIIGAIPCAQASRFRRTFQVLFCRGQTCFFAEAKHAFLPRPNMLFCRGL